MYWPTTEDYHSQQYHKNLFNHFPSQNGISQGAAAAVPPFQHQYMHQTQLSTQRQQIHHQQQEQHRSSPQAQTNFPIYPPFQPHQQHDQPWTTIRPILTVPPFVQYANTVTSAPQFCPSPQSYYSSLPQYPQPSVVSTPLQYVTKGLPQGCAVFPMAPSPPRNDITQSPPLIMTPNVQQMQVPYFAPQQFCHPPPIWKQANGHVTAPADTPVISPKAEATVARPRKHAIPIIDPITKENVLERKNRSCEPPAADKEAITTTPSAEQITESTVSEIQADSESEYLDEEHFSFLETIYEEEETEEDITDDQLALVTEPVFVVQEVEMEESKTIVEESHDTSNQIPSTTSMVTPTPSIDGEVLDSPEKDVTSSSSAETEVKRLTSPIPTEVQSEVSKQNNKKSLVEPSPTPIKPVSKKAKKQRKRLKESQKKKKAEQIRNEKNNENKADKNTKQTMKDPFNSTNRPKIKSKNSTKSAKGSDIKTKEVTETETCATACLHKSTRKDSEKVEESTKNLNTQNTEIATYDEISSKILGIDSNDNNALRFLSSGDSGYDEEISSICKFSAGCCLFGKKATENEEIDEIYFGDFSPDEISKICQKPSEGTIPELRDEAPAKIDVVRKFIKFTIKKLKLLACEPASKVPPPFRGQICEKIGRNPTQVSPAVSNTNNQTNPKMSKDSINLKRKRGNIRKSEEVSPGHQQFPQQQRKANMIRINLSLNEEIQLAKSDNAWLPGGLQPKHSTDDDEQILKKIRGILNKLTPENFDKLLQTATNFPMNNVERITKVVLLIFEKTVSEPNFAPTYARFCKFLFNPKDSTFALFKTILINRIQDEFDSNVNNAKAKGDKLQPLIDKLQAAKNPTEKIEIKAELDHQEYQFRRRAWGTVRFIGEMCKIGFIRIDTVCFCVETLLDVKCEEKLEYMCKLLTSVGAQLEDAGKERVNKEKFNIKNRMDKLFATVKLVVGKKKSKDHKISSRVRFMMQDILDLRSRSWDQKETKTTVPPPQKASPKKTLPDSAQQKRESHSLMTLNGNEGQSQQKNDDQQPKNTTIDGSKLSIVFDKKFKEIQPRFGNSVFQMWRNAGQHQQQIPNTPHVPEARQISTSPPTPPQQDLSTSKCERLLEDLVELVIEKELPSEWFTKWKSISTCYHASVLTYVLTDYVHSTKVKPPKIDACAQLFIALIKEKLLSHQNFKEGYLNFCEIWDDIMIDAPNGWKYIFRFLGPLLNLNVIEFNIIWDARWFGTICGEKFLQSMILHFTSEFGENGMRNFWDRNSLQWGMFLPNENITKFITNNGFEFIIKQKC